MNGNQIRNNGIVQIVLVLVFLLALNWIGKYWFFRLDLTSEKRYTLADVSKRFLKDLDEEVYVKVYLHGDLNPGFKRLANAAKETLEELKIASSGEVQFRFIDPNEFANDEKKKFVETIQGLQFEPQSVFETTEDGRKIQSYVFPYAIAHYKGKDVGIKLLDNLPGKSGDANLNISIEGLEFKIMDAFRKLKQDEKPRIAFLEGHGELDELDVIEATQALSEYYQVERGQIGTDPSVLDPYKVVIIAKPHVKFSEKDKFVLDQYLMNGGRLMYMVDAVNVTLDSLRNRPETIGLFSDVNIGDQLFKYGIRVNPVVVEDIQAGRIMVNVPYNGEPKLVPVPWLYSPLLSTTKHPVSRNVNMVRGDFTGTIDTTGVNMNLKRDVLLQTSQLTKVNPTPVFINMMEVNRQPEREAFSKSFLPVAVAQEGVFQSVFQNRMVPKSIQLNGREVKNESVPTRMVVVADGDIIKNGVRFKETNPRITPLGYDEGSKQVYGNKDFVVNAVNYLCDDEGWMSLRGRYFTLRLLDRNKVSLQASFYKWINVIGPILLVLIACVAFIFYRRKKYGK